MSADLPTEHARGPSAQAVLVCLAIGALLATGHYFGLIHWLIGSTKAAAANKPAYDYLFFALAPLALYIFRRFAIICLAIWLLYQGTQFAAAAGWISINDALWAFLIPTFLLLVAIAPKRTPAQIEEYERGERESRERAQAFYIQQRQAEIFRRSNRGL